MHVNSTRHSCLPRDPEALVLGHHVANLHVGSIQVDEPVNCPTTRHHTLMAEADSSGYSGLVDNPARPIAYSGTELTVSPSFEELAAQQGVTPIDDFEALLGESLPEDESAEEFAASLREWRREGTRPANRQ